MSGSWRFHPAAEAAEAPDWAEAFLEIDRLWTAGQAVGRTSGSTGMPADIDFTPDAVRASAHATARHFGLAEQEAGSVCVWSGLPTAGVGGRMMWWRCRILGWHLTQSRPSSAPDLPPPPDGKDRYALAVATPQQAHHLAETGALAHVALLLLGGAPVSAALESRLLAAAQTSGCHIHHGFGMTETLTHIATRPLGTSTYRPLPGVVLDVGPDGGLIVTDPQRGVHRLQTRDAVRAAAEGIASGFEWLGRLDHVINTGGVKVHPEHTEARLAASLGECLDDRRWYLAGRAHAVTGQQVTLVVEGMPDDALEVACLQRAAEVCSGPERPRSVEWQLQFEETDSGKVLRR